MSEPSNHHYIPVFLLKKWGNSDGFINRYSKPHNNKIVRNFVSARAAGFKSGLYSLDGYSRENKNKIEKECLSLIDSEAADSLKALLARDGSINNSKKRDAWIRFIISLMIRTPSQININTEKGKEILSKYINSVGEEISQANQEYLKFRQDQHPDNLQDYIKLSPYIAENIYKLALPQLLDSERTGNTLARMYWAVINLKESAHSLILGDNPLYRSHGLEKPECVVALPLTPRDLFIASHYEDTPYEIVGKFGLSGVAKEMNEITLSQAKEQIYSQDLRHDRFIKNRF